MGSFVIILAWPLRCLLNGSMTLQQSMDAWVSGDSYHYLCIAQDWYLSTGSIDRVVQLVFLPGYPILIRFAHSTLPRWDLRTLTVSGLGACGNRFYPTRPPGSSEMAGQTCIDRAVCSLALSSLPLQ